MKVRVKEVNPLKQGLKPLIGLEFDTEIETVKEVNPLKQGLKQKMTTHDNTKPGTGVKEVNPLKQGLKLCHLLSYLQIPFRLKK